MAPEVPHEASNMTDRPSIAVEGFGLRVKTLPGPKKVCKIMAFGAIIMGLGPLFHIFWGFR